MIMATERSLCHENSVLINVANVAAVSGRHIACALTIELGLGSLL